MGERNTEAKQVNFNSLLMFIALAAIGWNGSTTLELSKKMTRVETLMEISGKQSDEAERRLRAIEAVVGLKPKP